MKKTRLFMGALMCAMLLFSACRPQQAVRDRIRAIKDYVVYYGQGQAEALARYGLAIVQPETLSAAELSSLRAKGTLTTAYLSVGEAEPGREWFADGRVDSKWLLGENPNWGSFYVDAGQPGWQKLMISLAGEYIQKGFDGVFLDTVDTVDAYPATRPGMLSLIKALRAAYPSALLVMNRGFTLVNEVAGDVDAVMFEDLSTTYNFETKEYSSADNSGTADEMVALKKKTGLPILALDYVPPEKPGMALQAVAISKRYGFIPAVSVIELDRIVDYGLAKGGPPDLRVSWIHVEGDSDPLTLVIRVENTGLSKAVRAPFLLRQDGVKLAELERDLEPGEVFDWQVTYAGIKEGTRFTSVALMTDKTPGDNAAFWTYTLAALKLEPLLPLAEQRRRSNPGAPDLAASSLTVPPSIDGDLAEWKDLPCYEVNRADQVSYGTASEWGGPQDLSGRVCYGWDAQNLYVAFQVVDDRIVQTNSGANLWKGDHAELWFDTQLQLDFESDQAGDDDFQIGVSPGDFQKVKPDLYIFAPAMRPEAFRGKAVYAVVQTSDGYACEIQLPAKVLKGLRLALDNTIGVSFEPSDTDTPGGSDQEMMMSSAPLSSTQWGNPLNWNNLTLK